MKLSQLMELGGRHKACLDELERHEGQLTEIETIAEAMYDRRRRRRPTQLENGIRVTITEIRGEMRRRRLLCEINFWQAGDRRGYRLER